MSEEEREYVFRLYSSDRSEQMAALVADFEAVLEKHFPGCCRIEFIDVLTNPDKAAEDQVFVTPTLVKAHPAPAERLIGNLTRPDEVLAVLGILTTKAVQQDTEPGA